MKTAVIYARYSCDAQTEQSIEGQLRVCREYAERNGILIVDTYIDRAMTGTNDSRPDFQRMIKDSAKKQWSIVLVYKLDRFSRDKYASTIHKHTLKQNGVRLVSAMENIPEGPEGIILESLLEGMNQYYSAELSQKVKRGMRETREKGNFQGGHIPYGYKTENRKVVIDEEKASVVQYIYEQYASGVYVKDIIAALTEKGIFFRGKPFAKTMIYGILKNEKYSGTYRIGDEIVDKVYPPIISPEIFKIVHEKELANLHGKRSTRVAYLLRHKVKCGLCGESIVAESSIARDGTRRYYYKCRGRKSLHNGCKQAVFRKDILEKHVLDHIMQELSTPEQIEKITKALCAYQEQSFKHSLSLTVHEKEHKQNEIAISNIMTAIEQGIFTTTTSKRLRELENRQADLEGLIIAEKCKCDIKMSANEIRKFYQEALRKEARLLIEYLVKKVVVYQDEIHIYYNNPIETKSPDESQGFLLYEQGIAFDEYIISKAKIGTRDMRIKIFI